MWWDAMRSPAARWNHPKAVEKTVPWKPWKTKPRFPTAPTAPWKTRNLGEFPTFLPPCDSPFPSLKKTKGKEGSMKQADRSSVNKSGQIQKLPTVTPESVESRNGRSPSECDYRKNRFGSMFTLRTLSLADQSRSVREGPMIWAGLRGPESRAAEHQADRKR